MTLPNGGAAQTRTLQVKASVLTSVLKMVLLLQCSEDRVRIPATEPLVFVVFLVMPLRFLGK
jgi:hypothetical protein